MKFPGRRKYNHFFPVDARGSLPTAPGVDNLAHRTHVIGERFNTAARWQAQSVEWYH